MSYLVKAIQNLKPGTEFSFIEEDYSTIVWNKIEGSIPTLDEVNAEIALIKAEEATAAALKAEAKAGLLARLGVTAEEAELLLA